MTKCDTISLIKEGGIQSWKLYWAWLPTSALQWLNQKQAANIAVKACLAAVLGGLFAVFAVIGLLFKLMKYVAHM